MKYVYIIQSIPCPDRYYTGATGNVDRRLKEHNNGESIHTNKYKPWKLKTYVAFDSDAKANAFEAYLKSGNGRSFAKKRL